MLSEAAVLDVKTGSDPVQQAVESIHGPAIRDMLLELGAVGGVLIPATDTLPERYEITRLALSPIDRKARATVVKQRMLEAGMEVYEGHPFVLVGTYPGTDPKAPMVAIESHTDTVRNGEMYDGALGVLGGIAAVNALRQAGTRPSKGIRVLAFTGEESAAFRIALFGSASVTRGSSEAELDSANDEGVRIRDMLSKDEIEIVKKPLFGPGRTFPQLGAAIELHVEQHDYLARNAIDVGVVKAVAAAARYDISIGDTALVPDRSDHAHSRYLQLTVTGEANHSGATPMDPDSRADALLETANFLRIAASQADTAGLAIGDIVIPKQSINTIPGTAQTLLRVSAPDAQGLETTLETLGSQLAARNQHHQAARTRFGAEPLALEALETAPEAPFFPPEQMLPRQLAALALTQLVNEIAIDYAEQGVVATVSTYRTGAEGRLNLGLDIRGIRKEPRDEALREIQGRAELLQALGAISFGEPLAGSGDPVSLDENLVALATQAIASRGIGTSAVMNSAAGHDIQNFARLGDSEDTEDARVPSVLLFAPSRNGGRAHQRDADSSDQDLESGVRALTAVVAELAA